MSPSFRRVGGFSTSEGPRGMKAKRGENPLRTVAGTVELIPLRSERSLVEKREREVKRLPKLF
ncbi:MAG: hypothetical protein ACTS6P_01465 [Candidatus Hodgkinia cicadicola]